MWVGFLCVREYAVEEWVSGEFADLALDIVQGHCVDLRFGGELEAGIGGGGGVREGSGPHDFVEDVEEHVLAAASIPVEDAGKGIVLERAGDIGVLAAGDGEAHVSDAGWEVGLGVGAEREAGDTVVLRDDVCEAALGEGGGEGIVEEGGERDFYIDRRGVLEGKGEVESGGGGVALVSGHEWREDEGGDADRDGCVVVAELGDGEGGLVINGLDVLHVGERVVVAFIGAEIEAADLWDGVGLAVGAEEEAEILWAGAGRSGG